MQKPFYWQMLCQYWGMTENKLFYRKRLFALRLLFWETQEKLAFSCGTQLKPSTGLICWVFLSLYCKLVVSAISAPNGLGRPTHAYESSLSLTVRLTVCQSLCLTLAESETLCSPSDMSSVTEWLLESGSRKIQFPLQKSSDYSLSLS